MAVATVYTLAILSNKPKNRENQSLALRSSYLHSPVVIIVVVVVFVFNKVCIQFQWAEFCCDGITSINDHHFTEWWS